jgi:hypothetical protein
MVANNNEYLDPSAENQLKFKQASLALVGAYASFERRKAEVLYFINEDPKIQKALAESQAESNVKYLEVLERALTAGAELFSSISVRNPSQRGSSQRASETSSQERGSAPKPFVPGRKAGIAREGEEKQKMLGQARRASPHHPYRPSVQEGSSAQTSSPQSKVREEVPPKERSPSPKKNP